MNIRLIFINIRNTKILLGFLGGYNLFKNQTVIVANLKNGVQFLFHSNPTELIRNFSNNQQVSNANVLSGKLVT